MKKIDENDCHTDHMWTSYPNFDLNKRDRQEITWFKILNCNIRIWVSWTVIYFSVKNMLKSSSSKIGNVKYSYQWMCLLYYCSHQVCSVISDQVMHSQCLRYKLLLDFVPYIVCFQFLCDLILVFIGSSLPRTQTLKCNEFIRFTGPLLCPLWCRFCPSVLPFVRPSVHQISQNLKKYSMDFNHISVLCRGHNYTFCLSMVSIEYQILYPILKDREHITRTCNSLGLTSQGMCITVPRSTGMVIN